MFDFENLRSGRLGISATYGSFLAEAASFCLYLKKHSNPVMLSVAGDLCTSGSLRWDEIKEQHKNTWADSEEATEYGAYGVAIIVLLRLARIPCVQRSAKTTGIDYWLGESSEEVGVFQRTARLEVSGILDGDEKQIKSRLTDKLEQTKRSDHTQLTAYAAIIEFGLPQARFLKRTPKEHK